MAARFFGGLGNQLNQGISLRGLKDRLADVRAAKRLNPDFASACLQKEGDTGLRALAFNGEASPCCHRTSLSILLWMAGLATYVRVSASPVLLVWKVMSNHGEFGCSEYDALAGQG